MKYLPKSQTFAGRFSIYLIAGVSQQLINVALLPIFSHFLEPAEIGLLAVLAALEALLVISFDGAFAASCVHYYHVNKTESRDRTISRLFLVSLAVAAVLALASFVLIWPTWSLWTTLSPPSSMLVAILIAGAFFQRINLFAQQMYRTREQARPFAVIALVRISLLLVLSLLLVCVLDLGLLGVFLARALAAFLTMIIEIKPLARPALSPAPGTVVEPLLPIWLFAMPLLLQQLSGWARVFFDRILLSNFVGAPALGVYFAAGLAGQAFALLTITFDQTFAPWYYRKRSSGELDFRKKSTIVARVYLSGLGILCVVAMAVSPEIYHILFPGQFAEAGRIAPMIIAAQFINAAGQFFSKVLLFHRKTALIPVFSGVGMLIGFGCMIFLVNYLGVVAGALGLIVTNLIVLLGTWMAVRRIEEPDFSILFTLFMSSMLCVYGAILYQWGFAFELHSLAVRGAGVVVCILAVVPLIGSDGRALILGLLGRRGGI
ncbi:lipopolysaccharide biosynthesis protein [Xanthobacter tagetidis]|uniref:Lipopolysaccharide biosynthesis protein n=1 Tax=Xanthobacter tagetidis TaxID=60216 RepID=A0A3L7ALH8_9HYPH|nr:lipopolysaccharide biosynthesis protein [Xanthobacter tagetidis]MBB6307564.1 O-antigen/teichoic acid export membrane protein [Xanthobacter tagetidis]RLP81137.1 lipopolysaccharide biosynthesis protein [Xanthobacter tagetidis]